MMYSQNYSTYRYEESSVLRRWAVTIIRTVIAFGRDFCDDTSMHGFNHISAPRRHLFEKLLWVGVTALAIWGALDVSLGQLQRYNENPTVVTLEKDFRSWRFSLPAVTVCFWNRVDPAKLPSVIKEQWNIEPSDQKYPYYTRFVNAVASSDLFHLEKFEEFSDIDSKIDMFKIAVDVAPDFQIKTMSSEGANYKWIPVMTEAGLCFTTNSLALDDVAISRPNKNDTNDLPVRCKYSSLSCYIIMDVTTPANFHVHSPYDIMDITHDTSEIYLTLTRVTELSVMESRCGRGVKELQVSRRGCLYTDEPTSQRKVYSTNTCRLSCRSRLAKKLCGCIPFYYFYDDGPQCSPAGMWCLAKYSHQLTTNNGEKCSCAPQCLECIYKELSITDTIWDRLPFKLRGSIKYVVQAPRTRYTREIVFHFQDLVVSFGGAAGLFLGASFISFVEILYFLLAKLFRRVFKTEVQTKSTTLKAKKVFIPHEALRIKYLTAILNRQNKCEEYDTRNQYLY